MAEILTNDDGIYPLIGAIVQNAIEDIVAYERFKATYGCSFKNDPMVPEIPERVHAKIRRKGYSALHDYTRDLLAKENSVRANANDAREFLLGGWFYMLTELDGNKMYRKTVEDFWQEYADMKKKQKSLKLAHSLAKDDSGNLVVTYKGITKPLHTWCKELGINYRTVYHRIFLGETNPNVFFMPSKEFKIRNKEKKK